MTDLLVRDLDPEVEARLRGRASRNGSSVEDEARRILAAGTAAGDGDVEASSGLPAEGLGTRITRLFEGIGLRPGEELERPGWGEPRVIDFGP